MIVIVTGTPGTGKTTFAKRYASENDLEYVDGKEVIRKYSLIEKFDPETNADVIDEMKFAEICESIISEAKQKEKDLIIDSHLSQFINSKFVNKCFITQCDLKELEGRLKARGYSSKKIKDNLEAEIFKECQLEAQENGHLVEIIDTSNSKI